MNGIHSLPTLTNGGFMGKCLGGPASFGCIILFGIAELMYMAEDGVVWRLLDNEKRRTQCSASLMFSLQRTSRAILRAKTRSSIARDSTAGLKGWNDRACHQQ